METYRELVNSQVSTLLAQHDTTSAYQWLKKGEEWVPFNDNLIYDVTSLVRYAYRYALTGAKDEAIRLVEQSLPITNSDLTYNMDRMEMIESMAGDIEQQIREARQNADMKKAYELQTRLQSLISSRESLMREVYFAASRIFVSQRVFWLLGMDDRAVELANSSNILTKNMIGFPTNKEENKKQVDRIIY
jgi:hypothetical protein